MDKKEKKNMDENKIKAALNNTAVELPCTLNKYCTHKSLLINFSAFSHVVDIIMACRVYCVNGI